MILRRASPGFSSYRRGFGAAEPQYETCQPWDSPCVERNQQRGIAYQESIAVEQTSTLKANCIANANLSPEPWRSQQLQECDSRWPEGWSGNVPQVFHVTPQVQPAPVNPGTLTFQTSRGGSTLQAGDTWTVSIRGASPNQRVSVTGGKNGAVASTAMGTTDGNGNFSLSGTITSDQLGNWSESWFVGSVQSGSFSFSVAPATTPDGKTIIKSSDGSQAPGGQTSAPPPSSSIGDWLQGSMVGGIPNWALAGGAVAAFFLFGGGRGR